MRECIISPCRREIPEFEASERCRGDEVTQEASACGFLYDLRAPRLEAPPGARVYRETWSSGWRGSAGSGSILLTIYPDGRRTLETPWRRGARTLRPFELDGFEAALAGSDFAATPVFNQADDVCIDGVSYSLEAIVDGRYRLVYFDACGGVNSESIAQALDTLFLFATTRDHIRSPFDPRRPTYRGY